MNALEDAKHKLNLAICDSYGVPEEKVSDAVDAIVEAAVEEVLLRIVPSPFVKLKPIGETMRDNCNDFTCPNKCVPTPLLIQVSSDYEFEKATSLDDKTHYRKELWECVDCGQLFTVFCDVVAVEKLESTIIND